MSVKSERKKTVKAQKQTEPLTGFLVRKKYPASEEWFYFAEEMDFGYLWTPTSALKSSDKATVAIFPARQAADRMVKRLKKYHEERRQDGKASGFDVSVVSVDEFSQAIAAA